MRRVLALPLVFAAVLAGCGDSSADGDAPPVADGARRITVASRSFAFEPEEITIEAGEDVAIVLTSDDILHDFVIDELDLRIKATKSSSGEGGLRVDEAGTYTFYCSIPGHRNAGMEGTLVVE